MGGTPGSSLRHRCDAAQASRRPGVGIRTTSRKSRLRLQHKRVQQRSKSLAGAVQTRLDGSWGNAQLLGRLFGVELLNVAEEQDLPVRIGQPVDARPDVSRVSAWASRCQCLILPWPDRATVVPGFVEGRQQIVDSDLPAPRLSPQSHEADVDHDAMQPGPQGGIALKAVQRAKSRKEGVLHGVGAVFLGPEEPAGHGEHASAMLTDKCLTGSLVTSPDTCKNLGIVRDARAFVFGTGDSLRAAPSSF